MAAILVVDDEKIVARDLETTLVQMGHRTIGTASTSDEAIRKVEEDRPDLVIMDVRLRGEVDGIATAAILRERFDVPVVYLTAWADDDTVARAKATRPLGYVIKPFDPRELRTVVEIAVQRHHLETQLRKSEESLAIVLDGIGDAVIATDAAGRVTRCNAVAEALTGWSFQEALGRPLADVLRLLDEADGTLLEIPPAPQERTGIGISRHAVLAAKDGSRRPIEGCVAPFRDVAGEVQGNVLVLGDQTERRALEGRAILQGSMGSVSRLALGVAHEVGNPLACVMSNLDFAARELPAILETLSVDDRSRAILTELGVALAEARLGAGRVRDVVHDLKLLAGAEDEQQIGVIEIRPILEAAIRLCQDAIERRARLVREYGELPQVEANDARLSHVFVNLVMNAAQAIPEGHADDHRIRVRTRTDEAGRAVVEISDTGSGIPLDELRLIFDPFFTTRPVGDGPGLGLPICAGVVRAIGGEIEVESEVGKGSCFRVILPAARLSGFVTRGGAAVDPIPATEDFAAAVRAALVKAGWPEPPAPDELCSRWASLVQRCIDGYPGDLIAYDADLAVRDQIQVVLQSPEARALPAHHAWALRVAPTDLKFRMMLQPDVDLGATGTPWWRRGVLLVAGDAYASEMRSLYGVHVSSPRRS